ASVDVDPAGAGKMSDVVVDLADELAQKGVSGDELERARAPLLTAIRESMRDNTYWLSAVVSRAQEKPEVLDWARTRLSDIEGMTADDVSAPAKKYLAKDRASRATIVPEKQSAAATDKK
ncbi:MAG: insulinase family protein, partial [Chthoniobacterales bacterium]